MMRATLVQLGHTAHRVPSTDAFAVGSSQCPSAAAGSHSFRVCCAVDAFIALGGRSDKSGEISTEKLRAVIKDFGLTIDIDRLIRDTDTDHSGLIDYEEFKQ